MSLVAVAVGLRYYLGRLLIVVLSWFPVTFFLTCRARESLQKAIEIK